MLHRAGHMATTSEEESIWKISGGFLFLCACLIAVPSHSTAVSPTEDSVWKMVAEESKSLIQAIMPRKMADRAHQLMWNGPLHARAARDNRVSRYTVVSMLGPPIIQSHDAQLLDKSRSLSVARSVPSLGQKLNGVNKDKFKINHPAESSIHSSWERHYGNEWESTAPVPIKRALGPIDSTEPFNKNSSFIRSPINRDLVRHRAEQFDEKKFPKEKQEDSYSASENTHVFEKIPPLRQIFVRTQTRETRNTNYFLPVNFTRSNYQFDRDYTPVPENALSSVTPFPSLSPETFTSLDFYKLESFPSFTSQSSIRALSPYEVTSADRMSLRQYRTTVGPSFSRFRPVHNTGEKPNTDLRGVVLSEQKQMLEDYTTAPKNRLYRPRKPFLNSKLFTNPIDDATEKQNYFSSVVRENLQTDNRNENRNTQQFPHVPSENVAHIGFRKSPMHDRPIKHDSRQNFSIEKNFEKMSHYLNRGENVGSNDKNVIPVLSNRTEQSSNQAVMDFNHAKSTIGAMFLDSVVHKKSPLDIDDGYGEISMASVKGKPHENPSTTLKSHADSHEIAQDMLSQNGSSNETSVNTEILKDLSKFPMFRDIPTADIAQEKSSNIGYSETSEALNNPEGKSEEPNVHHDDFYTQFTRRHRPDFPVPTSTVFRQSDYGINEESSSIGLGENVFPHSFGSIGSKKSSPDMNYSTSVESSHENEPENNYVTPTQSAKAHQISLVNREDIKQPIRSQLPPETDFTNMDGPSGLHDENNDEKMPFQEYSDDHTNIPLHETKKERKNEPKGQINDRSFTFTAEHPDESLFSMPEDVIRLDEFLSQDLPAHAKNERELLHYTPTPQWRYKTRPRQPISQIRNEWNGFKPAISYTRKTPFRGYRVGAAKVPSIFINNAFSKTQKNTFRDEQREVDKLKDDTEKPVIPNSTFPVEHVTFPPNISETEFNEEWTPILNASKSSAPLNKATTRKILPPVSNVAESANLGNKSEEDSNKPEITNEIRIPNTTPSPSIGASSTSTEKQLTTTTTHPPESTTIETTSFTTSSTHSNDQTIPSLRTTTEKQRRKLYESTFPPFRSSGADKPQVATAFGDRIVPKVSKYRAARRHNYEKHYQDRRRTLGGLRNRLRKTHIKNSQIVRSNEHPTIPTTVVYEQNVEQKTDVTRTSYHQYSARRVSDNNDISNPVKYFDEQADYNKKLPPTDQEQLVDYSTPTNQPRKSDQNRSESGEKQSVETGSLKDLNPTARSEEDQEPSAAETSEIMFVIPTEALDSIENMNSKTVDIVLDNPSENKDSTIDISLNGRADYHPLSVDVELRNGTLLNENIDYLINERELDIDEFTKADSKNDTLEPQIDVTSINDKTSFIDSESTDTIVIQSPQEIDGDFSEELKASHKTEDIGGANRESTRKQSVIVSEADSMYDL